MCSPFSLALLQSTPAVSVGTNVTHLEPAAAMRVDPAACWSLPRAAGMADQDVLSSFDVECMEEEPERWDGLS